MSLLLFVALGGYLIASRINQSAVIGFEAGVIDQTVYVVIELMSLLTTVITPIVYRNWFFKAEDCRYDARGICIDEGK